MATIICPSCSKELGDDVSFCPKCGAPIKADSLEKITNLSQEKNTETEDVTKLNNNDEQNSTIQKKKPTNKYPPA
ncbi:zinc-ribbon domain-containing protein [Thomasclavelia sp.]